MRRIVTSVFTLLVLICTASLAGQKGTYRINGVKEFHNFNKKFINSATNTGSLTVDKLFTMTINVSRVNIFVDDLTDNSYLKPNFEAIASYIEFLSEKRGTRAKKLRGYLEDLRGDIMAQNKSDRAGGTKTFKYDIGSIVEDNSSNYDMKKEILKQGKKTAARFIPRLSSIDSDIVSKANELQLSKLTLDYFHDLNAGAATALLTFKGKKISISNITFVEKDVLEILAQWPGELSVKKLSVTDKNVKLISSFKASKLEITGLKGKYSSVLTKQMGKRFKKKIKFKKRKK